MEVAAGTWCNKCMGPVRLDQHLMLTSCSHVICESCIHEMGPQYAHDICPACSQPCQTMDLNEANIQGQSMEIQDVIVARQSEAILAQAVQRVSNIEAFKRKQFREQIMVQQQRQTQHAKELQNADAQIHSLQSENKQLRQENKRLNRGGSYAASSSSGGGRPMTSRTTPAEDGFFGRGSTSGGGDGGGGRPHTGYSSSGGQNLSRARSATAPRPGTRGRSRPSSAKGRHITNETPPRRPFTPGDSAGSAVGQVLGGMSNFQQSAPAQSPAGTSQKSQRRSENNKRVDRFGAHSQQRSAAAATPLRAQVQPRLSHRVHVLVLAAATCCYRGGAWHERRQVAGCRIQLVG